MTAAIAIARVTLRQVLGVRRLAGLGLLGLAPGVIFYLTTSAMTDARAVVQFLDLAAGLLFAVVLPVVTLILATSALGDERRGSTMSFLVLRPIPRWMIAASKMGAAWAASFVIVGGSALILGVAYGARVGRWNSIVPLLAGVAIGIALYVALFVPLGMLFERAVLTGLIYVFIWENSLAGAISGLAGVSLWRIALSGFAGLMDPAIAARLDSFALGSLVPGAGGAAAKAFVVVAASVAFTSWLLRRRDLA